jgi:hypothetical protein
MRSVLVSIIICSAAQLALADSPPPISTDATPSCAALAKVPADAAIPLPAISARVSTASCVAEAKFTALQLKPDDASIAALTAAAKPSIDALDAVIQENDPVMAPIAKLARADLFQGMAVRIRNSITPITMATIGPQLALIEQQHVAIEPKIQAWLAQAH